MVTEELIRRLSADVRPVSRLAVARRLALGVGAGAAASAVLTAATLGLRTDMAQAVGEAMFWVKLAYTLGLGGVAIWACERLVRPAARGEWRALWLAVPVLLLASLAAWQLAGSPAPMRMHMMMGDSAKVCPWCILTFALPPLVGLIWAARGLAPTRLRLTGAMIGLAAGGAGASAYALHCPESAAPFMAIWYTLGMVSAAVLGGLLGPRVLRW
jgi:hypothetical protein